MLKTEKGTKKTLNQLLKSCIEEKKHTEKVETKTPVETPNQPVKTISVKSYVESFIEEDEYTASQTSLNFVSLNGIYLRIRDNSIKDFRDLIETFKPAQQSCIKAITYELDKGTITLATEFHQKTKCTDWMDVPSDETKQKLCRKFSCAGECIDTDMRKVFAHLLPEMYGTTLLQR